MCLILSRGAVKPRAESLGRGSCLSRGKLDVARLRRSSLARARPLPTVLSIEALGLLLFVLYLIDAVVVCDPGATLIVGWRAGTARAHKGLEVPLGRPRMIAMGRLLPPLDPPMVVDGHRLDADAAAACTRGREGSCGCSG